MANLLRRRRPSSISRVPSADVDPYSTWDDMLSPRGLKREIERLFDEFFAPVATGALETVSQFVPSLELTEADNEYVLRAELPGLAEGDVQVEVDDNNCITISGEKKSESTETRGRGEYSERVYGQFCRTVQLPKFVDASKIAASFQNGVLELHVPKSAQPRARAIPIGKGKGEPKKMEAVGEQRMEQGDGSKAQEKAQQQQQQEASRH